MGRPSGSLTVVTYPLGLFNQQVDMALRAMKKFAVDPNVVFFRVGLGAEFGDGLTIHLHASRRD